MTEKFSIEEFSRIYSDDHGYFFEVRPDSDGAGCIEIKYSDGGEAKIQSMLTCSPLCARLIASAMIRLADDMESRK